MSVAAITGIALASTVAACGSSSRQGVRSDQQSAVGSSSTTTQGSSPSTSGQVSNTGTQPKDCPANTFAPYSQYSLALNGSLTGTLYITHTRTATPAYSNNINANLCSALNVSTLSGVVAPDNVAFGPANFHAAGLDLPTKIYPDGDGTTQVVKTSISTGAAPNGGLEVNIKTTVLTVLTFAPGSIYCDEGPITISYSTANPGGKPITGPLNNATALLTAYGFTVPAVQGGENCDKPLGQGSKITPASLINLATHLPSTYPRATLSLKLHTVGDE